MTSSLKSRFDFSDKRALLVTGDRLAVFHWHRGALTDSYIFGADDSGRAQFRRYLEEYPNVPAYMMVDVVEEEYRLDTIPHVFGRDRRALLQRKQARLFRGAPYCHALMQGRETEGRKDDRVLLMALMNAEAIVPWVDVLSEHKVPLAGIYSLPALSKLLLDKLDVKTENVLLVTMQNTSGLRQSFFRGRDLKISRLAKMPRLGTVPYGEYLLGELEKLRRYLNSLRLPSRDGPLDVYILSHGALLEDLQRQCRDDDIARYHLYNVKDIAEQLGISEEAASPYCDRIFAHLLLSATPPNHYASGDETRYYGLHRARIATLAASVLLVLGSTVWGGFNFIEGVSLKQQGLDAQQKADFYQARYEMARETLPPTPVEPRDIKTAVELVETLAKYKANPLSLMQVVSDVLGEFPSFRLDKLDWIASTDPAAPIGPELRTPNEQDEFTPPKDTGVVYDYYQIGLLQGSLEPFDGDYRKALSQVNRFAEFLRTRKAVQRVKILKLPLDVSSEASLKGSAGAETAKGDATFSIKLVLGISNGASES